MPRWEWLLVLVLLVLGAVLVEGRVVHTLGGDFNHAPEDAPFLLDSAAKGLIARAYRGLGQDALEDYGVRLLAVGSDDNDGGFSPHQRSWWHPLDHLRLAMLLSAAGMRGTNDPDRTYVARLVRLIRAMPRPSQFDLLALDRAYLPDGTSNPIRTQAYVPNAYLARVSARHDKLFHAVVSINPYRPHALRALKRWGQAGVRGVYWLPSAQGINPADPKLKPFYAAMKRYALTLFVHSGRSAAIRAGGEQRFNNPLRLRLPLNMGVKVVMMSAGTLGRSADLDKLGHPEVASYQLCLRLLDDPRYRGRVFASLSGLFYDGRPLAALSALLQRPDLADRVVYASDYPFSAEAKRINLNRFVRGGYLNVRQARLLREIYGFNPLLFSFVLARTVHLPHTDVGFQPAVFQAHPVLDGTQARNAAKDAQVSRNKKKPGAKSPQRK